MCSVTHMLLTCAAAVWCRTCCLLLFRFFSQYVQNNKSADNDWFRLESNKDGTRWFGKCWYIHNLLKYEFDVEFDVSALEYYRKYGQRKFTYKKYFHLKINYILPCLDSSDLSNYCTRNSTSRA